MRELSDRWIIPIEDFLVRRCCVDYAFALDLSAVGCGNATIRIEGEFELRNRDGRAWRLRPQDGAAAVAPALTLFGLSVTRAEALKDGSLSVMFADGSSLRVAPDPTHEAWEYLSDAGGKAVSMPGGEIAVWRPAA
jgi:hypothetical protein